MQKQFVKVLFAGLLLSAVSCGLSAKESGTLLQIPRVKQGPVIDGKASDPCWKDLPFHSNFCKLGTKVPVKEQTRFKVCHDNWNLYVLAEADEPAMEKVKCAAGAGKDNEQIWLDDSLEINLVPVTDAVVYYKYIINTAGGVWDLHLKDDNTGTNNYTINTNFNGNARIKVLKGKDRYTVECAIPLYALDLAGAKDVWRFNVGRNRYAGGRRQLSSYSILSWPKHGLPGDFALFKLQDLKLPKFRWDLNAEAPSIQKTAKGMEISRNIQLINRTGDLAIAYLDTSVLSSHGKVLYTSPRKKAPYGLYKDKMKVCKEKFLLPGNGKYLLKCNVVRVDGRILAERIFPLEVRYEPVRITVQKPVYRNCIFATMPDKEFIAEIAVDTSVHKGKTIQAVFSGNGKKITRTLPLKNGKALFRENMKNYPDGSYFLQCGKQSVRVRKLPYLKGEVFFGANGGTYVDGKPFVPYGWSGDVMTDTAFNMNVNGTGTRKSETFFKIFDRYKKIRPDFKTVTTPFCEPDCIFPYKVFHYRNRKQPMTAQQRELLKKHLLIVRNHETLFGYNGSDEPEGKNNIPEWYAEVRDMVEEYDPYHPIIILNEGFQAIEDYAKGGDIRMPDCYVNFLEKDTSRRPLYTVSHYTRQARRFGPAYIMPQGFCWNLSGMTPPRIGRPPTFDELRNQAYQVFANDGKGILWYSTKEWSFLYDQIPLGTAFIGHEIKPLTEFIVEKPSPLKFKTVPADPQFQAMLKSVKGHIVLFAVNTSRKPLKATFSFPAKHKKLYVLSENRSVVCNNGFTDSFKPLEVHVYMSQVPPKGMESLADFRKRLDAAHKNRFTPGNLIGTGPLTRQHYMDYNKKLPAAMPVMTASSQFKTAFVRDVNTLHFLLDGLRNEIPAHNWIYDAWMPAAKDKQPYVDIELRKPSLIREVRLFAMREQGIIHAVDIKVFALRNGKKVELASVKGNTKHKIILPLKNVTEKKIRIQVTKLHEKSRKPCRLFSEVELIGSYK